MLIDDKEYSIVEQGNKRTINVLAVEYSQRKVNAEDFFQKNRQGGTG